MSLDGQRIGVIGLSGMGGAVARRLATTGFDVTGHEPRPLSEPAQFALAAAGVRMTRLPADAAEPASLIIVDLSDDRDREDAIFQLGGVGDTLRFGGHVLDVSGTPPGPGADATRRLARLGLVRLEAALVGPPAAALSGELSVVLGCSRDQLLMLQPVLRALTTDVQRDVSHLGDVGTVATLALLASTWASVRDAAAALVNDQDVAASALQLLGAPPASGALRGAEVDGRVIQLPRARDESLGSVVPAPRDRSGRQRVAHGG